MTAVLLNTNISPFRKTMPVFMPYVVHECLFLLCFYHGIVSPLYRKYLPLSAVVADVITLRRPATLSGGSSSQYPPLMSNRTIRQRKVW